MSEASNISRDEKIKNVISVWEKVVDVQQHFNDIILRVRGYGITIFIASIGAAGLSIRYNMEIIVLGKIISLAAIIFSASLFGWMAILFMDRFWYHKFLLGAVEHGIFIEKQFEQEFPQISLATAIKNKVPSTNYLFIIFYGAVFVLHIVLLLFVLCFPPHTSIKSDAQSFQHQNILGMPYRPFFALGGGCYPRTQNFLFGLERPND